MSVATSWRAQLFSLRRGDEAPRELLNWRLWYGVLVFGILGVARGLDEGLIGTSASLASFKTRFGLDDPSLSKSEQAGRLGNITSMVQVGSIGGALVAFYIPDKIGRLWALRQLCFLWIAGIAIFLGAAANGSLGMVYAGRLIAGLGIGQTTVIGPTYLAEISPKFTRGLCVCVFAGSAYLGIMLGYLCVYGASRNIGDDNQLQWVLPNLLHIYFAVLVLVLSFGALESPRWLAKTGKMDKAAYNLSKIRSLSQENWYFRSEWKNIIEQIEGEKRTSMTLWAKVQQLVSTSANRYRLMLAIFAQILSQWSGANSITIYAAQFFEVLGVDGQESKLFSTAILGVVAFVTAIICAVFLVDFIGRKRALLSGVTLQFIAIMYEAIFLSIDTGVGQDGNVQTPSQRSAATGAIAMIYISSVGWALGWNSLQYLINSEIFPLQLRAVGTSTAMTLHYANLYGNSKAVPLMFIALTTKGTFYFFAAITLVGAAWAWFFLPELAGKSLEACDAVFALPWYQIGRKGKYVEETMIMHDEEREGEDSDGRSKDVAVAHGSAIAKS